MKAFLVPLLALLCSSCIELSGYSIDSYLFSSFGWTLFSSPQQITLKEVHLDTGFLLGSEVVIEADVVDKSDELTFVVVKDSSARMLVVLTSLALDLDKIKDAKSVKVWGTVESGKKGLPYIGAKALNVANKFN